MSAAAEGKGAKRASPRDCAEFDNCRLAIAAQSRRTM